MSFDNMPTLGAMFMPGANDYAAECLRLGRAALAGHRVAMDVAYGADPFQQLDVWAPPAAGAGELPVIVFIHGGAMRNGFKEWIGAMAPSICALPAILVSPNYRLVPAVRNIDAMRDCLDALAWVHANIARHGGDPSRIYVGGHSAGAYLAALLAARTADQEARGIAPGSVRGCLPVSGIYTMDKQDLLASDGLRNRFWSEMVADEAEAAEVTVYRHVGRRTVPFLIAYGENEPPEILHDGARMETVAREHGFLRERLVFPGCDHFYAHMACIDPQGPWLRGVRGMLTATA